ncbi:MAG: PD-(D/E)XK nuclease family protein [Candidatus Dormibacteria bacterium]
MTPRYPAAWSYSAWADYVLCPHKYEGRRVLKMPEPPSQALVDGNAFHVEIAAHIRGQGPPPQRNIHARIVPIVEQLRSITEKTVEEQWAFTAAWKPTGWFSRAPQATWLRVIVDVCVAYPDATAHVGDWKTGKRYDSNDDQMELFAVATFARRPWINDVETRLWYVDSGHEEVAQFKRAEAASLRAKWEERAARMLGDRTFTPRPNDKCRFCVRARQSGGDCKFG